MAYRVDGNIWWRLECGHHENLRDAARDRLEEHERPATTQGDGPFEFRD